MIFSNIFYSSDNIAEIVNLGLKEGNTELISSYFNENIRLKIEKSDHIYSRNQAKAVLKEFFEVNKPINYEVTSKREIEGTNITTGKLSTTEHDYRIYYQLVDGKKGKRINYFNIQSIQN